MKATDIHTEICMNLTTVYTHNWSERSIRLLVLYNRCVDNDFFCGQEDLRNDINCQPLGRGRRDFSHTIHDDDDNNNDYSDAESAVFGTLWGSTTLGDFLLVVWAAS